MKINKSIKILMASEVAIGSASCIISPVFAVFILDSIEGGTIEMAGTAVAISLVVKSIIRVPLAYYLDKSVEGFAEYYSLVLGFLLFALLQFMYLFARLPIHIYILQAIYGLAVALAYTPWYGFFSKKLDRHHEDYEWSINLSLGGLGGALASYLGGFIAQRYGFSPIFVISGIIMLVGTVPIALSKSRLIK